MRVFLAIAIPGEIQLKLAEAIKRLSPSSTGVKWVERGKFHLTVLFIGELPPSFLPHASEAVRKICAEIPSFELSIDGYGFWGTKRNPTSVWASADLPPELESLQEKLAKGLKRLGIKLGNDDYRPHITLGRCKAADKNRALLEAMDQDEQAEFGRFPVTTLNLYESRLTPKGPIYKTVEKFPLLPPAEE